LYPPEPKALCPTISEQEVGEASSGEAELQLCYVFYYVTKEDCGFPQLLQIAA
jgi:hypothetical protein